MTLPEAWREVFFLYPQKDFFSLLGALVFFIINILPVYVCRAVTRIIFVPTTLKFDKIRSLFPLKTAPRPPLVAVCVSDRLFYNIMEKTLL